MKKIIYTRPDGGVSVIIPAPKEKLERVLGPLTEAMYEEHVRDRSIPPYATNVRSINESDLPTREFRDAWVDVSDEPTIDIDLEKVKDIKLKELRLKRNEALQATDVDMTRALEDGDSTKIDSLKIVRQALRDKTTPLKNLNVHGKINDVVLLQKIKDLGEL